MTDQPPAWLKVFSTTLVAISGIVMAFATSFADWAASNPAQAQWLGWSTVGIGAVGGIAGLIIKTINQTQAEQSVPRPPMVDGEPMGELEHILSLAVEQALQSGKYDYANELIAGMKKQAEVK